MLIGTQMNLRQADGKDCIGAITETEILNWN